MGFQLPECVRTVWRTPAEQQWWEAKISRIIKSWPELERESVALGVRRAALQTSEPEALPDLSEWATHNGLVVLPVSRRLMGNTYSTLAAPPQPNRPWSYRTLITWPEDAEEALAAVKDNDGDVLGELLGYPTCCRRFFEKTWGQGQRDSLWESHRDRVDGPVELNQFLRHLGVRLVPHIPCSPDCAASLELAQEMVAVGRSLPGCDVVDDISEMLAWPATWSRVHGLAELVMPACKIVASTDYTPGMQRLDRSGVYQPVEMGLWSHNGFSAPAGMLRGHTQILEVCRCVLTKRQRVVDIGAGNGRLLTHLRKYLDILPVGVELKAITPLEPMEWYRGNIADRIDVLEGADAIIMSPNRINELSKEQGDKVRTACLASRLLIVYCYDDGIKAGGLEKLVTDAGLPEPLILTQNKDIVLGVIQNGTRP